MEKHEVQVEAHNSAIYEAILKILEFLKNLVQNLRIKNYSDHFDDFWRFGGRLKKKSEICPKSHTNWTIFGWFSAIPGGCYCKHISAKWFWGSFIL